MGIKYVRLLLFLLIGILFFSLKGCEYEEVGYGFPTIHLVKANYWMYGDTKIIERNSYYSYTLKDSALNLTINIIFAVMVWLALEKLNNSFNSKSTKIFESAYNKTLYYVSSLIIIATIGFNTQSDVLMMPYVWFLGIPSVFLGFFLFGIFEYFGLINFDFQLASWLNPYYSDGFDLIIRIGFLIFMILLFFLLFISFLVLMKIKLKRK